MVEILVERVAASWGLWLDEFSTLYGGTRCQEGLRKCVIAHRCLMLRISVLISFCYSVYAKVYKREGVIVSR